MVNDHRTSHICIFCALIYSPLHTTTNPMQCFLFLFISYRYTVNASSVQMQNACRDPSSRQGTDNARTLYTLALTLTLPLLLTPTLHPTLATYTSPSAFLKHCIHSSKPQTVSKTRKSGSACSGRGTCCGTQHAAHSTKHAAHSTQHTARSTRLPSSC